MKKQVLVLMIATVALFAASCNKPQAVETPRNDTLTGTIWEYGGDSDFRLVFGVSTCDVQGGSEPMLCPYDYIAPDLKVYFPIGITIMQGDELITTTGKEVKLYGLVEDNKMQIWSKGDVSLVLQKKQ